MNIAMRGALRHARNVVRFAAGAAFYRDAIAEFRRPYAVKRDTRFSREEDGKWLLTVGRAWEAAFGCDVYIAYDRGEWGWFVVDPDDGQRAFVRFTADERATFLG